MIGESQRRCENVHVVPTAKLPTGSASSGRRLQEAPGSFWQGACQQGTATQTEVYGQAMLS